MVTSTASNSTKIERDLDDVLTYHINLILSYAERNPLDALHENHLGDPIFELFGLTDISFTRKRWAAGFANSCATNLGRFTDKAAKIILADAFGLSKEQLLKKVEIRSNNTVEIEETDGVILASELTPERGRRVRAVAAKLAQHLQKPFNADGVGFELRGRYGKNDDTLIQKDEHMAEAISSFGSRPRHGHLQYKQCQRGNHAP